MWLIVFAGLAVVLGAAVGAGAPLLWRWYMEAGCPEYQFTDRCAGRVRALGGVGPWRHWFKRDAVRQIAGIRALGTRIGLDEATGRELAVALCGDLNER